MAKNIDDFLDIELDFFKNEKNEISEEKIPETSKKQRSVSLKRHSKNIYRRAYSETQLLDICDMKFEYGTNYNFITSGDVDALSYLKLILRVQDLEHVLFSTWCMALEDVYQIEDWLRMGKIKKIDAYVGEIFPNSYKSEYKILKEVLKKHGGKVVVFKNHSKVFAGYGEKFYFGIQTSANINTNPRTENGCITIDKDIYFFYKEYYENIKSFAKEEN